MAQDKIKQVDEGYYSETLSANLLQNVTSDTVIIMDKSGRVCRVGFPTGKISTGGSGWTNIATVPQIFRPHRRALGILMDDTTVTATECALETTGLLRIWNGVSGHSYWGSFVYIL